MKTQSYQVKRGGGQPDLSPDRHNNEKSAAGKIYDCFSFFNELDILEIRLNVLNDIVDKFVIVEAVKTHTGKDKPLYFLENKERFKNFEDKIIHIIVDDIPPLTSTWVLENYQRNCILRGLKDCKDNDIIMISDADEIPDPKVVMKVKDKPGIKSLKMFGFYYWLNNVAAGMKFNHATKILSYRDYKNILDDIEVSHSGVLPEWNRGTTATKIRLYDGLERQTYYNYAGWHFGYAGGADVLAAKLQGVAVHGDENAAMQQKRDYKQDAQMLPSYQKFEKYYLLPVKIDSSFPEYLVKNKSKYKHLLTKETNKTLFWDCIVKIKLINLFRSKENKIR